MALNSLQSNFTLGELAPEVAGWVDLPNYKRGVYTAENFLIGPNGDLTFRPGTYYAANTAGNAQCKLIPFIYSDGSAYVIEATPGRFRFYINNGSLDASYTITGATWASSVATITVNTTHCFLVGDAVTIASVSPSGYNGTYVLTAVTGTTLSYALATNPGTYSSGGTATGQYQVTSPFATVAQLPVSWAQSDDVLYLTDPTGTIAPQQLSRLGAVNFTITAVPFTAGPFLNANTGTTTMTVATNAITASAATFASTDVGRLIMVLDTSDSYNGSTSMYKWGIISTYTDSTHVSVSGWKYTTGTIDTSTTFVSTGAQTDWRLGAWSATTGYPTCVTLYQQRLIFGGEVGKKQTFGGSVSGYYTGFSPFDPDGTVNPDNAYRFNLASGRADKIVWLENGLDLYIGTTEGEYVAASQGPAITPTDISVKMQTKIGSSGSVNPIYLSYRLMLLQRGGVQLNEWARSYFLGGYYGEWVNQQQYHITYPGIGRIVTAVSPFLRLWMPRTDGQAVVATDSHEAKGGIAASPGGILGFTRIVAGGSYSGGNAVIEDMCVIPTTGDDQVWMVVKRTINGATVRTVEYLTPDFNWNQTGDMTTAFQVDCGLAYSGASTSTLTGLSYLNGAAVVGWDRANAIPISGTVSGGALTLGTATTSAIVGLQYTGTVKTMPIGDARIQGHAVYPSRAYLRLYKTYGGTMMTGVGFTESVPIPESAATLYTGSTRNLMDQGSQTTVQFECQQVSPYPMTLLNISVDYSIGST